MERIILVMLAAAALGRLGWNELHEHRRGEQLDAPSALLPSAEVSPVEGDEGYLVSGAETVHVFGTRFNAQLYADRLPQHANREIVQVRYVGGTWVKDER